MLCLLFVTCVSGCGTGGYPGGGVTGILSLNGTARSAVTIDAGQSFPISAVTTDPSVSWSMGGCPIGSCGSFTGMTGTAATYHAPTSVSAPMTFTIVASIPGGNSSRSLQVTVNPDPALLGTPAAGIVQQAYSTTLATSGGTAPVRLSVNPATLPSGLTFNAASNVVSGTPTYASTYPLALTITDGSDVPYSAPATSIIIIKPQPAPQISVLGTPAAGMVGMPYSTTLQATGGTAPYSFTQVSGTLPNGLTLSSNGTIAGMPTTAGNFTFAIQAKDANNDTGAASFTIVLAPAALTITTGSLPNGTVGMPYSGFIGVNGGTSPYTCTITSGSLPAGLALGSGCSVAGTPTVAGTATFSVAVADSGNPALTASANLSITIAPVPLSITTGALPNGTVGAQYSATIGVSGGTGPYNCTITSGTLPIGLTLGAGCAVSGTPTTAGTANLTVKATDSAAPAQTATGPVSLTIAPAPLNITVGSLPDGVVGTAYSATVPVTGGTAPYNCSLLSGNMPAGLTLGANCVVSGTPLLPETQTPVVRVTDAGNPTLSATRPVSIKIVLAATLKLDTSLTATQGVPFTGLLNVSGGTSPYTCALVSGTLPAGLSLNGNCTITGTPSSPGTATVTVGVLDSSNPPVSVNAQVTVTVNPAPATLTLSSPPAATVGTPYTGTIGVSGGTAPYSCTVASGTLPSGLTLGANCVLTGTPATAAITTVNITATDSANPAGTVTGPVTITVNAPSALTLTGSLPNATVGVAYMQTLHANGGIAPYTYAVTAGSLPPGLALSSTGGISGTPTAPGASSFTVTATDSEGTAQTANLPLLLLVVYPTTPKDTLLSGPYAFLFQGYDDAIAGVLAYQTAAVGSFTADGTGVVGSGQLDANHQASNPTGTTVNSNAFLGTYTIGMDDRGSLTITTLNADGTVAQTSTYAIAVKAAVSPAVTSPGGSLIEFDNNLLAGTKGSGTFLAQTASSFATGLKGSYAFGVQGDVVCFPACTVGVAGGPAAAVGQFTADGSGTIANGTGDETISSTTYANSALSGSYGAADGNGRVAVSLTTANMPLAEYPVDYAMYMVDANHAFVMSTDKHSAYILLAGSATLQGGTFSNASATGPYVGYENSPTNPGLVGATLQNVLNLTTSTIFRGTGDGNGTCTTTNVDVGGTTGLVNGLTGLGSGSNVLNALLGTYQSTGDSNCTVAANGREVLNYPVPGGVLSGVLGLLGLPAKAPAPRVVYLYGANQGYFLETGYAGLGQLEAQTGAPFQLGTFNGNYVYETTPAASAASTDTSGIVQAHGDGTATTTYDLNVGVGSVNVLQLGTTGNVNYTLTDPTAGRFLLGASTVIYAIAPGRFVLLDTSAATTSPSAALLF